MSAARTADDTFTHILNLLDGHRLTLRADHGAFWIDVKAPHQRFTSTNRLPRSVAETHRDRVAEVIAAIPVTGAA